MIRTLAFIALLCTTLTPMSLISFFEIEIEVTYDWDSGEIALKQFDIIPQINANLSSADAATIVLAKTVANQMVLLTTKDLAKTAYLTKQIKTIVDKNTATELKIKKARNQQLDFDRTSNEEKILAKNKLCQLSKLLKDNNKEV